jgi:hypothetical protein
LDGNVVMDFQEQGSHKALSQHGLWAMFRLVTLPGVAAILVSHGPAGQVATAADLASLIVAPTQNLKFKLVPTFLMDSYPATDAPNAKALRMG